ncbi:MULTISPECIES: hypothetical protein [Leptospira]|uniref:Uncharacterized protein n=3 Tax=Leptospira borgpetersenii TaxID=174 RepID=A0A0E3AYQ1_LEPBO|nr:MULTISPECIES: hypothetical protein [Leptospira]EMO08409.1 hypothetical protein LEP1GSC137_0420 [Leptospira borgpetersenii str. Noumea 25]ALO28416.1 hypothetical protein LBBP_04302 [Leptospira borgpetersenii serovar Ballum]ALO28461.1 hypothetical protein LBBP_04350 [Leptospira borgpetersenii serovar Ballum]ANH02521.1 Uncharacterized protein LB4E_3426 [Leptospira borgpetersenii str. 4E]APY25319.1 Uncharacterized protein LB4E_3384 [Leptospira borgpetersenii str. 4E]
MHLENPTSSISNNIIKPTQRRHFRNGSIKLGKTFSSFSILGTLLFVGVFLEPSHSMFSQNASLGESATNQQKNNEQAETKPLLRVFPSYRKEECDWAIRWDICLNCLKIGRRYAQKIHFYPSRPYREHGCYSDEEGFFTFGTE